MKIVIPSCQEIYNAMVMKPHLTCVIPLSLILQNASRLLGLFAKVCCIDLNVQLKLMLTLHAILQL